MSNAFCSLHDKLQDDISRDVFWKRLRFDLEPTLTHVLELDAMSEVYTAEEKRLYFSWRRTFEKLKSSDKKILLYGAGAFGQYLGGLILRDGGDFFGYVDRAAERFPAGEDVLWGKPVLPPDYLFTHADECVAILTTTTFYKEIVNFLTENHFPKDHILPFLLDKYSGLGLGIYEKQYFEFPELFRKGTAFVDGGAFDGDTSIRFARWCGGEYSKILAFEPDPENRLQCQKNMEAAELHCFEVVEAGIGSADGEQLFAGADGSSGHIMSQAVEAPFTVPQRPLSLAEDDTVLSIRTVPLDSLTRDIEVGFIKLDVEGAELDALRGALQTIRRDKPLLTLSVYHRLGDVLTMMDYISSLVPEYRFWLRHYGPMGCETVLYAAVKET